MDAIAERNSLHLSHLVRRDRRMESKREHNSNDEAPLFSLQTQLESISSYTLERSTCLFFFFNSHLWTSAIPFLFPPFRVKCKTLAEEGEDSTLGRKMARLLFAGYTKPLVLLYLAALLLHSSYCGVQTGLAKHRTTTKHKHIHTHKQAKAVRHNNKRRKWTQKRKMATKLISTKTR